MKSLIPLAILALLVRSVLAQATEAETALRKEGTFAVGGIGYAAAMSPGERALREVLAQSNAAVLLENLLPEASAPGQLYALLGFRSRDRDAYKRALAAFGQRNTTVQTMRGCIRMKEQFRELVKQIDHGEYDAALSREWPDGGR